MNDLHRYLSDQAEALPLPAGDPAAVTRRAARRHARRRVRATAGIAAACLLAVSVAVRDDGSEGTVESTPAATVVDMPLTWSVASPTTGLGYSSSAVDAQGVSYSLSTMPGAVTDEESLLPALYRSTDGVEWEAVELPDGFRPRSLAAGAAAVYALGTVPAGGEGAALALAQVGEGAPTAIVLPDDLAALAAAHPEVVRLTDLSVAALDDQRLVAAATVRAVLDVDELVPGIHDQGLEWTFTDEGIDVHAPSASECVEPAADGGCADGGGERVGPTTTVTAPPEGGGAGPSGTGSDLVGLHTWAELGVEDALVPLIVAPRVVVLATEDGEGFAPVSAPTPTGSQVARVTAADGAFHLLVGEAGSATLHRSEDGRTWTEVTTLPGHPLAMGSAGDAPVAALGGAHGPTLYRVAPGGGVDEVDLLAAADHPEAGLGEVAVGPLGIAGIAYLPGGEQTLLFSPDGRSVSASPLAEVAPAHFIVVGVQVTADGVFLRGYDSSAVDDDPETVVPQVVLVGTP